MRIARTLKEMGITPIVVYSEPDRTAPHGRACEMAFPIGPGPAPESYLRGELLIEVAKRAKADAIYPGYGFLSENPAFAEAVTRAGLVFIGPTAAAMRAMGSKTSARQNAIAAKVPVVPGSDGGRSPRSRRWLGEHECSMQRRHQKIIEELPDSLHDLQDLAQLSLSFAALELRQKANAHAAEARRLRRRSPLLPAKLSDGLAEICRSLDDPARDSETGLRRGAVGFFLHGTIVTRVPPFSCLSRSHA